MSAVNQRIPNFLGGVSQQPDKIKFPGQLRVCDNAVPDITFGLKNVLLQSLLGLLPMQIHLVIGMKSYEMEMKNILYKLHQLTLVLCR